MMCVDLEKSSEINKQLRERWEMKHVSKDRGYVGYYDELTVN